MPRKPNPKPDDPAQSKRFEQAAREVEVERIQKPLIGRSRRLPFQSGLRSLRASLFSRLNFCISLLPKLFSQVDKRKSVVSKFTDFVAVDMATKNRRFH